MLYFTVYSWGFYSFFFMCVWWCKKCGCEHTELHNYFVCTYNTQRKYVGVQKVLIQGNYLSNLWLHSLGKITLELHSINDKCLIRFSLIVVEKMFFETCLLTAMEIYSRRPRMIYTSYLGRADRIVNRPTTITKG